MHGQYNATQGLALYCEPGFTLAMCHCLFLVDQLCIGPCDFNSMQYCSHAPTLVGGLDVSVDYYLSGIWCVGS